VLNLKPLYGQNRCLGLITGRSRRYIYADPVVKPTSALTLKPDMDEVLSDGRAYSGYYKDPGITPNQDSDAGLRTGDAGFVVHTQDRII